MLDFKDQQACVFIKNIHNFNTNMFFRFFLTSYLLFFAWVNIDAQIKVDLQVLDATTNEPIAYAHLYGRTTKNAFLANELGRAQVLLPTPDSLVVEALGYETKVIFLTTVQQPTLILLKQRYYEIKEVVITPDLPRRTVWFGADKRQKRTAVSFCGYQLGVGHQALLHFDTLNKGGILKNVSFFISKKIETSEKIRIRVYKNRNGKPDEDLLSRSIICTVRNSKGWQTVDMQDFMIEIPTEGCFIGIEFLGSMAANGQQSTRVCIGLTKNYAPAHKSWFYMAGNWWNDKSLQHLKTKEPVNLMINIEVNQKIDG